MQSDADLQRIRDRMDNEALDTKYRFDTPEEAMAEIERLAREAIEYEARRIDAALAEAMDIKRRLKGGTLDYESVEGFALEYIDEIILSFSERLQRLDKGE